MKLKFGSALTSASVKLGGSVIRTVGTTAIISNKGSTTLRLGSRSYTNKVIMAALSQGWRQLTDQQRKAWNTYNSLRPLPTVNLKSFCKSGYSQFKRCNYAPYLLFGTIGYTSPPTTTLPYPITLTVFYNYPSDNAIYTINQGASGFNNAVVVWVSKAHKKGYSGKSLTWRLSQVGPHWHSTSDGIPNLYASAWGHKIASDYYFFIKIAFVYFTQPDYVVLLSEKIEF